MFIIMIKNKLYLYACSFGKFGTTNGPDADKWVNDNSFGSILAEKLDLKLVNRSWTGGSNHHLFINAMRDLMYGNIQPNDLIVIQYTHIARAWCNDLSKTVLPHSKEFEDYYKQYYSDFLGLSNLVSTNTYLKSKFENKFKCKFVYSTADDINFFKKINHTLYNDFVSDSNFCSIEKQSILPYVRSLNNKDLFFSCEHPSKEGHAMIADLYHRFINML